VFLPAEQALLQKLGTEPLAEMQELGKKAYAELAKEIPSFVRRSEEGHRHQISFAEYRKNMREGLEGIAENLNIAAETVNNGHVHLLHFDPQAVRKVAAALVFPYRQESLEEISESLSEEGIAMILEESSKHRNNRRHKSPRALENAEFTFEIVADFGVYRDLQRHRMLTQDRQKLSCHLGYFIPEELLGTEMEKVYREAMDMAKESYKILAKEFPEEAQYVVPMAYNIRWYYTINLRALQWLCELRSAPQGHKGYRYVAQEMAHQIAEQIPEFAQFFAFVDFEGHYPLGRLEQEERKERKKALL
jgi:thymidylate synthase ThyX